MRKLLRKNIYKPKFVQPDFQNCLTTLKKMLFSLYLSLDTLN